MIDSRTSPPNTGTVRSRPLEIFGIYVALLTSVSMHSQRAFQFADEGFAFLLARDWAQGVPLLTRYRLIYPPGEHVLSGLPLLFWDSSFAAFRLGLVAMTLLAAVLLARPIAERHGSRWAFLLVVAIAAVALPRTKLLASALVFTAALQFAEGRRGRRWVFGWSLAAGLLFGVREDSAVLLAVIAALPVATDRRRLGRLTDWIAGMASGLAIWIGIFALRGEGGDLLRHVAHRITFLLLRLFQRIPVERPELTASMPISRLAGWSALPLGFLLAAIYLGFLLRELRASRRRKSRDPVVIAALLVGLAYLPQFLLDRPDFAHFRHHLPIALAALSLVWLKGRRMRVVAALLLVACTVLSLAVFWKHRYENPLTVYSREANTPRLLFETLPPWAGDLGEGGLLVHGWGPGWYIAEGVHPPTPYLSMFPRHLDDEARDRLREVVERREVRWVLVQPHLPWRDTLGAELEAGYARQVSWRGHVLWERRSGYTPSP